MIDYCECPASTEENREHEEDCPQAWYEAYLREEREHDFWYKAALAHGHIPGDGCVAPPRKGGKDAKRVPDLPDSP